MKGRKIFLPVAVNCVAWLIDLRFNVGLKLSDMNKKNWSKQGERGNIVALKLIAWIAMHLGRRVSRWVLIPTVAYFFLSSPQARSASKKFLSKIPEQASGPFAVYRHLYVFAAVTLDRI